MRVTYIVANYNYSEWILDCIKSICEQDYPKELMDICVIDDCSTDDSVKKVFRQFEVDPLHMINATSSFIKDVGITVIQKEKNSGPSHSRNLGIKAFINSTDAFLIVDADDIIHPKKTRTLIDALTKYNAGVAYANYINWDIVNDLKVPEIKEPFSIDRLGQECIVHSGSLIRKECFEQCGLYDEEMRVCEDYDLWIRIAQKFNIIHVPEILTTARVTPKNSTNTVKNEVWQQNWRRIQQKYGQQN